MLFGLIPDLYRACAAVRDVVGFDLRVITGDEGDIPFADQLEACAEIEAVLCGTKTTGVERRAAAGECRGGLLSVSDKVIEPLGMDIGHAISPIMLVGPLHLGAQTRLQKVIALVGHCEI